MDRSLRKLEFHIVDERERRDNVAISRPISTFTANYLWASYTCLDIHTLPQRELAVSLLRDRSEALGLIFSGSNSNP